MTQAITPATRWEYAIYYDSGSGDQHINFWWSQGEDFVARAKDWFKDGLKEKDSHQSYLKVKMSSVVTNASVLGFMGSNGWEFGGEVDFYGQGGSLLFKRPWGNADIATRT